MLILGKYFPPWTVVTRKTWCAADIMLFHQHGRHLVHRYRVPNPSASRVPTGNGYTETYCDRQPSYDSGPLNLLASVYSVIWDDLRPRPSGQ